MVWIYHKISFDETKITLNPSTVANVCGIIYDKQGVHITMVATISDKTSLTPFEKSFDTGEKNLCINLMQNCGLADSTNV